MKSPILRIATRKSPLALWQAHHVKANLLHYWPQLQIELLPLITSGDRFLSNKLQAQGGKGLFVKELEEALIDGRADIAVHSMKDVPALLPHALEIPVICRRHNPYDAFVSPHYLNLDSLPKNAIVGTASLRRTAQLLAKRPDLNIKSLRGNVNTRLSKLEQGEFDAIILAVAGLERLSMNNLIREVICENIMVPACGQGALGIECRKDDELIKSFITPLHDPLSSLCLNVERQVNTALGGSCHTPVGIFCMPQEKQQLILHARVLSEDGRLMIEFKQQDSQENAAQLAQACVRSLFEKGAQDLLSKPDTPCI